MSTKNKIMLLIGIVLAVIIIIVLVPKGGQSGQYDQFAQTLKSDGANFYGAFWCPHCQAEKKLFGSSAEYLPYVECSKPDGSTQTQICIDKKIEGYPSWTFKDGITLTSDKTPTICEKSPGVKGEPSVCGNVSSKYNRVWVFPDYAFSIKSPADPVKQGTTWKFPPEAMVSGEIPLSFLAQQINFVLPQ